MGFFAGCTSYPKDRESFALMPPKQVFPPNFFLVCKGWLGKVRKGVCGILPMILIQRNHFLPQEPKGPFRTKNTTAIAKIVNYYAVVFLLRPPNLVRRGPFFERKNVCNSQENGVRTRRAAIVNHPAVLKNSTRSRFTTRSIFSTAGSFG